MSPLKIVVVSAISYIILALIAHGFIQTRLEDEKDEISDVLAVFWPVTVPVILCFNIIVKCFGFVVPTAIYFNSLGIRLAKIGKKQ